MLPALAKGTLFLMSMQEKFSRLQTNIKLEQSFSENYINRSFVLVIKTENVFSQVV